MPDNPYESPAPESQAITTPRASAAAYLGRVLGLLCIATLLFVDLRIGGALVAFGSIVWLLFRAATDGAFSDPVLFLTGVSVIAYVAANWDRARAPILVGALGVSAMFVGFVLAQPSV